MPLTRFARVAAVATALGGFSLAAGLSLAGPAAAAGGHTHSWAANPPKGFIAPPINPTGVKLRAKKLGEGVYAIVSGHVAVDNNGFIVGERGVLVIDAHINGAMARQIQALVKSVTDKPILYLVNTNYHGDHTFGNYAFPKSTKIIAHAKTAARMRHFNEEKRLLLRAVDNDPSIYADVRLRMPDVTFDDRLTVDLGGRVVHVHHFGPGNTPGDTVVYEPRTKTAWTGNLVVGEGTIPPIFEGGTRRYLGTIARFAETLEVRTIIPGHGAPTTGATLGRYLTYLNNLIVTVEAASRDGLTLAQTIDRLALPESYLPPKEAPNAKVVRPFLSGLHRLNVQQTYLDLNGE